jgi:transcriptional regulator with XRE-family HTH domain
MDLSDLATLVRRRRLDLRLTQREAARRAGVSLATWQSLERHQADDRAFQELTLVRVADGLQLSDQEVFVAAGRDPAPFTGDAPLGGRAITTPAPKEGTGNDAQPPERLVEELGGLLLALAARSEADFMLVYGQALEAADHLLTRSAPPATPIR